MKRLTLHILNKNFSDDGLLGNENLKHMFLIRSQFDFKSLGMMWQYIEDQVGTVISETKVEMRDVRRAS